MSSVVEGRRSDEGLAGQHHEIVRFAAGRLDGSTSRKQRFVRVASLHFQVVLMPSRLGQRGTAFEPVNAKSIQLADYSLIEPSAAGDDKLGHQAAGGQGSAPPTTSLSSPITSRTRRTAAGASEASSTAVRWSLMVQPPGASVYLAIAGPIVGMPAPWRAWLASTGESLVTVTLNVGTPAPYRCMGTALRLRENASPPTSRFRRWTPHGQAILSMLAAVKRNAIWEDATDDET